MLTRSLSKLMLDSPENPKLSPWMNGFSQLYSHPNPNYLLLVPEELLTHIFSFLSLSDIGILSLTGSSQLRDRVVAWINTTSCCKKVMGSLTREDLEQQAGYEEWIRLCRQFGLLCKRVSMLYSTSTRLELLSCWYGKLECLVNEWDKLWGRLGLAAASASFSLGWDEAEFGKVVEWLWKLEGGLEGDERRVLRIFFWEFVDIEDTKASWLSFILKTFTTTSSKIPVENQAAHLLYLLLGPREEDSANLPLLVRNYSPFMLGLHSRMNGKPDWNIMQEKVPLNYSEAKEMFSDLGRALRLLLRSPSIITRSFLTAIMTSLFGNLQWHIDNRAACLLFSCEAVVKMFLSNLVRETDGVVKLSHMLVAMMVVCGRLNNNIDQGIDKILDWSFVLLEGAGRKRMIAEFWKEAVERMEEGEVAEDIMVQLGGFVGERAYGNGSPDGKAICGDVHDLEE